MELQPTKNQGRMPGQVLCTVIWESKVADLADLTSPGETLVSVTEAVGLSQPISLLINVCLLYFDIRYTDF